LPEAINEIEKKDDGVERELPTEYSLAVRGNFPIQKMDNAQLPTLYIMNKNLPRK
jgi:hypothetical protein